MLSTESTGMHFCKQRTTVLKMKKVPDVVQITERGAVQEVHFIGKTANPNLKPWVAQLICNMKNISASYEE